MLSIICCSIDPHAVALLKQNIEMTIGDTPFEFIAFDNRNTNYGLCKVYNLCASKAKFSYLCFVHEDICFDTKEWGRIIIRQLQEKECGVIGFAGSVIKLKRLTAWNTCGMDMRANYVQHMRGRKHYHQINPDKQSFTPVITLDGLCLFVRCDVWREVKFDEHTFTHFHCYDIDFALAVACRYTNFICNTVLVEHFSEGSFSSMWLKGLKILHKKWHDSLPIYIKNQVSTIQLTQYERLGEAGFIKLLLQKGLFKECCFSDVLSYIYKYPQYGKSWMLILKYLKYRLRYLFH